MEMAALTTGTLTIASIDDIDRALACRAFRLTSMSPEDRGERVRKEYAEAVNGFYVEMWPLAKTDQQKDMLATEMERYRKGYLARIAAFLASHAQVASPMITGPARFPTSRNEKRSRWADGKASELVTWDAKARAAIKRKLLDARPEEDKVSEEWERVKRDVTSSLGSGNTLIHGNLAGRLERMACRGEADFVRRALDVIRDYNATADNPVFTARHKVWTFAELAEKAAAKLEQAKESGPETVASGSGVVVMARPDIERVQIVFDGKPSPEMINKLKGEAWKWSPREGAWQRKLTDAAKVSAKRLIHAH